MRRAGKSAIDKGRGVRAKDAHIAGRPSRSPVTPGAILVCYTSIVAAGALVYGNSFGGVFLLDDYGHIVTSSSIQSITPLSKHLDDFRPLVHFTLAANYALSGLDPWGYHAVNLAIHLLAGLTLFALVRRTLCATSVSATAHSSVAVALAVALIWVVHPLQTQAVTYVIQRGESMMGLFYLLTLYCVIRGAESARGRPWYCLAIAACAMGMLSKEAMVTAPVIVFLYDAVFLARSWSGAMRRRWGLYALLCATWGILVYLGLFHDILHGSKKHGADLGFQVAGLTPWTYLLTQPEVILHYFRLCVWPYPQCFDYGWEAVSDWKQAALPGMAIIIMLAATVWALKRRPAIGFLGAWVFIILAPTSSIVPIKVFAFEHRMYLPLAAVIAFAVLGAIELRNRLVVAIPRHAGAIRTSSIALGVTIVLALGVRTLARNADYSSASRMWADVVAQRPRNVRAWNSYGVALSVEGRIEDAVRAYGQALAVDPTSDESHVNLGKALAKLGHHADAVPHYQVGLRKSPDDAMLHHSFAISLEKSGRLDEALAEYRRTIELDPGHPFARYNIGLALKAAGRWQEALAAFRDSLAIQPHDAGAHYQAAACLANMNQKPAAVRELRTTLQLDPRQVEARKLLDALDK